MRNIKLLTIIVLLSLIGCKDKDEIKSPFDNVAYLEAAINKDIEDILLKSNNETERFIKSCLAYPENRDVEVHYKVDPSLVAEFNKANYTKYEALSSEHYDFVDTKALIPKGQVRSTEVKLSFKGLKALSRENIYVLPLSITQVNGVDILEGSKTIYYVIKKAAPITTVAQIQNNHLSVPGFSGEGGSVVNGLKQITMEALVRVHDFDGGGKIISTVMGVEDSFLIRLGDAGFYQDQIQVAGSFDKFPAKSEEKRLKKDEWQHVALTYDKESQEMIIYVNGKEQSKGSFFFWGSSINLGRSNFYIGKSYDDERDLRGEISECRIWSIIRTPEEIAANIYEVDSDSEGLAAYWKFDEGSGNTVKDHTKNGNDARAFKELKWLPVSLP